HSTRFDQGKHRVYRLVDADLDYLVIEVSFEKTHFVHLVGIANAWYETAFGADYADALKLRAASRFQIFAGAPGRTCCSEPSHEIVDNVEIGGDFASGHFYMCFKIAFIRVLGSV